MGAKLNPAADDGQEQSAASHIGLTFGIDHSFTRRITSLAASGTMSHRPKMGLGGHRIGFWSWVEQAKGAGLRPANEDRDGWLTQGLMNNDPGVLLAVTSMKLVRYI